MKNIAVFVSGRGSNLEAILNAVESKSLEDAKVAIVISDNPEAYALTRAKDHNVPAVAIERSSFKNREEYEEELIMELEKHEIDLIVLAGFMRVLSRNFISKYHNKMINIHPSLLPSFPGLDAQAQALEYGVKYTGCTVHFVTEGLDNGPIIGQKVVPILDKDDHDTLASRILEKEHKLLIECIKIVLDGNFRITGRIVTQD